MRLMVLFDLPVETSQDRRNYRKFQKTLIQEGFFMMQYSVYVRVCANSKAAEAVEQRLKGIVPADGLVQTLMMTEKQYQDMHFLAGKPNEDILNSADRTVII
ncbi:CRISPR-associated endonuclease Cas2 [Levilactobacillus suantsaii]|uniref:CRISPR-associated endoribonuclease Cas2 n=1 Tax=Levilactobacillus suantsaii TaxID=2292255 RepID=A0A4Q0VIL8_9LACO|nr:CRISPR-associated endonuclease Cas2 [Levilactobacillus suantsaii]QMU07713.1 CRISPR-associated endonuclease Cas2 [Levilactobacillus suantsaii]RXI78691.1 CRISPR-associated endonuclease Cas2 [Levilactobacillus suantsaii]